VRRPSKQVAVGAGILIGLALLAALAYLTADVVAEGQLLPYTPAEAERLRIFGMFEVTIQHEPPSMIDSLGSASFVAIGAIAILTLLVVWNRDGDRTLMWFYGVLAAGMAFLGLDEVLGFHEAIGANLRFLEDLPGVNSPEDVVIALYAVPTAIFAYVFWDKLRASRIGFRLIVLGTILYVFAAALDVLDALMDEQLVELSSAFALLAGFMAYALEDILARQTAERTAGRDAKSTIETPA
jgi:uncharacterized membrane protein